MDAQRAKQIASMPRGNRSGANDPDEQSRYLRGPAARQREQLMRQFIKGYDGPRGTTEAYREGWDRIFGKQSNGST